MTVRLADGRLITLDGREMAPAASTALPPSRKACNPASVATGFAVATRPLRGEVESAAVTGRSNPTTTKNHTSTGKNPDRNKDQPLAPTGNQRFGLA